jgi:hypothetical protein
MGRQPLQRRSQTASPVGYEHRPPDWLVARGPSLLRGPWHHDRNAKESGFNQNWHVNAGSPDRVGASMSRTGAGLPAQTHEQCRRCCHRTPSRLPPPCRQLLWCKPMPTRHLRSHRAWPQRLDDLGPSSENRRRLRAPVIASGRRDLAFGSSVWSSVNTSRSSIQNRHPQASPIIRKGAVTCLIRLGFVGGQS